MKPKRPLLLLLAVVILLAQAEWCSAARVKKKKPKRPVIVQELSPFYTADAAWKSNIKRTPPSGNILSDLILTPQAGISLRRRNTLNDSEWAARASYSLYQFAANSEQSHGLARLALQARFSPSKTLRLEGGYGLSLNRSIEERDFNIYTGNADYSRHAFHLQARRLLNQREWWKGKYSFAQTDYSDPTYDSRDSTANTYGLERWKRFSRDLDASIEYSFSDLNVTQGGYSRDVHLLTVQCDRKTNSQAQWRLSAALRRSIFDTYNDGTGAFDRKDTRAILGVQYARQPLSAGVEYLKNVTNDTRAAAVDFGDFTAWTVYANWSKEL